MNHALEVSSLGFKIGSKELLSGIGFTVPSSQTLAVIGHNGAGKTTLFHLMMGLKYQVRGDIKIFGKSNLDANSRASVGYVPERPYLNLELTFEAMLRFHAQLLGMSRDKRSAEVQRVAQWVGLLGHL